MKKIISVFLSVAMLLCCFTFSAAATEISAERGTDIEIVFSVAETAGVKSGAVVFEYDAEVFEIVSGEWLLQGNLFTSFKKEDCKGVFLYMNAAVTVKDGIFKLVLRVKDTAALASTEIAATLIFENAQNEQIVSESIFAYRIVSGFEPVYGAGDINADGSVTVLDIMACVDATAGKILDPESYPGNPDVNSDGSATVLDIMHTVDIAAGKK